MIPLEEASAYVLARCHPLIPRRRAILAARGHVLAETVRSTVAVPPFDNSAMDGFAVHVADCAAAEPVLRVGGAVSAGQRRQSPLGPGEAVRIMTGAPIPPGADAVCPIELTRQEGERGTSSETVVLARRPSLGDHIRPRGDDIRPGDVVARAGDEVVPSTIGVLASIGRGDVECYPRPKVGVLSTGNELSADAESMIFDTNRAALEALLESDDFLSVDLGVVSDDIGALTAALAHAASTCDAVLTTGGVSVGERDVVRLALDELPNRSSRSMQVAIKPAKPLAFTLLAGIERSVPLFGLPGNPVSALVSYELFARPGLRKMAGHTDWWRPVVPAVAGATFARRADGKHHFVCARTELGEDGNIVLWPVTPSGSHQLRAFDQADALASLPDGGDVEAGSRLRAMLLRSEASLSRSTTMEDLLGQDGGAPFSSRASCQSEAMVTAPQASPC